MTIRLEGAGLFLSRPRAEARTIAGKPRPTAADIEAVFKNSRLEIFSFRPLIILPFIFRYLKNSLSLHPFYFKPEIKSKKKTISGHEGEAKDTKIRVKKVKNKIS